MTRRGEEDFAVKMCGGFFFSFFFGGGGVIRRHKLCLWARKMDGEGCKIYRHFLSLTLRNS